MAGSLPSNRIKKIKLPGDVEGSKTYDIVPSMITDGSTDYKLEAPTLSEDSVIATTKYVVANPGTTTSTLSSVTIGTTSYKIKGVDLVTTAGSESISDGTNTINVVTRNTEQTISGKKTFSTAIYSSVSDINFIGTQGKIGLRAYKPGTTTNAGQILVTSDGTVSGSYRLSMQAYDATADKYNSLRIGDTESLTYKAGDNVVFRVDKDGTIHTTGSSIKDASHTFTLPSSTGTLALESDIPQIQRFI